MKKILLLLTLTLSLLSSQAQSVYTAVITEMYTKNDYTNTWELYSKNSDVNIDICIEEDFITFFAQRPSMYKVYESTKESISFSTYSGFRYTAKDLKRDLFVKLDLVRDPSTGLSMISVVNTQEKFNLRYFLVIKK